MKTNVIFCSDCKSEQSLIRKEEWLDVDYHGEYISVKITVPRCKTCGRPYWTSDEYEKNLFQIRDLYRKKHHLLLPKEIKEIHKRSGLSCEEFDRRLGFPAGKTENIENGGIQNLHQDNLIFLMSTILDY